MRRFVVVITLGVVLFSNTFITTHTVPHHDMRTMGLGKSSISATHCITSCSTVVLKDDEKDYRLEKRRDDEPLRPDATINQTRSYAMLSREHSAQAGFSAMLEPPPRLKSYIELSVFRA